MFRKKLVTLVVFSILLGLAAETYAKGGRSFSSGGRSSSAGRSYSTGSSASKPSYSSSKPSSSSSSSSSKYSGGSKPTPSPSSSNSKYSSGSKPSVPSTPSVKPTSTSTKPTSSTFNKSLSDSSKVAASKSNYVAANTPKSTYKTPGPSGKEQPVNQRQVQTVRNYVTHERYVTYDNRSSGFYGGFYQPAYYHDPFSPFLMGYLFSSALSSHDRAMWMYHHQDSMDENRYKEMLAKDAKLQAELDQLKAQNLAKDPNYAPPQMADNKDVMYNKEFIDAAYNPVEVKPQRSFFWNVLWATLGLGLIVGVVYFVFVKDYK